VWVAPWGPYTYPFVRVWILLIAEKLLFFPACPLDLLLEGFIIVDSQGLLRVGKAADSSD